MRSPLLVTLILFSAQVFAQGVGIGTETPNASSILDLTSDSQGFLAPRMTQGQRDAINLPATGLLIYQTDGTPGLYYYSGSAWSPIAGTGGLTTVTRNATLTGAGTAASPLGISLGNANTWTANQTFSGAFLISNGSVALTNSNNVAKDIRFQEPSGTGNQYVGFRAPSVANNGIYVLPAAVGSVGQALTLSYSNNIDTAWMQWSTAGAPANATTQGNTFNGASQLLQLSASAKVPTANLGTGTASSSRFLRGDGSWNTPSGSALNFIENAGSTYNIAATDDIIGCDVSSNGMTLTLPAANSVAAGKTLIIRVVNGDASVAGRAINIGRSSTDLINYSQTSLLISQGTGLPATALRLFSDGVNQWWQY